MIYRTIILLSLALALASTLVAAANDAPGNSGAKPDPTVETPKLRVKLHSSKTHVLLGEPFWLSFAIENVGTKNISIARCAPPGSDYLIYEIVSPGKQPRTILPRGVLLGAGMARRLLELQPSDAFSRSDDFTYERNGLLLDEPGEYTIHAVYSLPDGIPGGPMTIRSNGICIVAEEPTCENKEVYDALTKQIVKQNKDRKLWSAEISFIQEYENILQNYPRSTYCVYIYFYLAQAYEFYATFSTKDKGVNDIVASLEKATQYYERVADLLGDTPLGIYARQLAGRCYATLGRASAAEERFRSAFYSSSATSESQIELLSWIKSLDPNTFYNESGLSKRGYNIEQDSISLPLRPYARALGYELEKDKTSGESVLTMGDYKWVIKPGENALPVCGILYKDMRVEIVKESEFRVSPSVIAMLIAERYGKDMARQLSFMLTRAK